MVDLAHEYGADLAFGPTGDLAVSAGAAALRERLLRRLLTSPGDYLWQLDYGAGLGRFVGQPAAAEAIAAVARGQMYREAGVAHRPEPEVVAEGDRAGGLSVAIRYADAAGTAGALAFGVGGA